jgi:hypothetical protein
MLQKLDTPISVVLVYNHKLRKTCPTMVVWEGRNYKIKKLGLHHTYYSGRTLFHVYSVASETIFFRLVLDTDTLNWRLTEISDGESQ